MHINARAVTRAAAFLVITSMGAVAALPALTASARYYSIEIGFIVGVSTPTGVRISLYPPMLVPEVLLVAAAFYALRGVRSRAAYLSIAALSYYIVVALELARGLSYLRGLAVLYGSPGALYSVLVVPEARPTIYLPPLIVMTIASASTLIASTWPEIRRALEAAEELARRRFGVSLDTLRRRSPGIAEAVETYARFAPGHGASSRSYLLEAAAEARLRDLADAEARRRFGVSLDELERTRPWAARALLEMAKYMPEARGGNGHKVSDNGKG
ncbi:hypothetical protein [Acidilobus sp. 7A]|uniref:hypothetical protein n=1 Tax=Acidilobus sp. 7A TaxID=1577685 RepID=UPI000764D62B|nr:hypothetical protein [Acidilobus sp. 7A]AMD30565.1 hypothetical protein SE86_03560 [Acidilobus sp. 7A]